MNKDLKVGDEIPFRPRIKPAGMAEQIELWESGVLRNRQLVVTHILWNGQKERVVQMSDGTTVLLTDPDQIDESNLVRLQYDTGAEKAGIDNSMGRRATPEIPPPRTLGLLRAFRWFCGRDSREIVDLVFADVSRDIMVMAAERRSRWFIRLAVWRHVYGTLASVSWNAALSILKKLAETLGLIREISR